MSFYIIKEIVNKELWQDFLMQFEDANIYQLWNYYEIIRNDKYVKYFGIFDEDKIVAMTQVRVRSIPLLKKGFAYIFNGPVWRKKDANLNKEQLSSIYKILRNELVSKGGFFLRINPNVFEDDEFYSTLEIEGFTKRKLPYNHKTIYLNLEPELEVIRAGFKQRWRKTLNRAEKNEIEIVRGTSKEIFDSFLKLYYEMRNRKKFKETISPEPFGKLIQHLDDNIKSKINIFIAKKDGLPVSALIGVAIGATGLALFSATNDLGMKLGASSLLHWERIKWFKECGCKRYDLGGVNPDTNKSVYEFKLGISQCEYAHIGIFEASPNNLQKLTVNFWEYFRTFYKKYR